MNPKWYCLILVLVSADSAPVVHRGRSVMDREESTSKVKRKPIIGMTCGYEEEVRERFYINRTYIQSIEMAGGIPPYSQA